jgi:hypothetical protein
MGAWRSGMGSSNPKLRVSIELTSEEHDDKE